MANYSSCNSSLSPLVTALHSLPPITSLSSGYEEITFENLTITDNLTITVANIDSTIRVWFWGALLVILTVALILLMCVFYCCACCCCCGKKSRRKKSKVSKIGCALSTVALISLTIILMCVCLWLETVLDGVFTNYLSPGMPSMTSNNFTNSSSTGFELVSVLEYFRFRISLGIVSTVILVMLMSLFAFGCAPCCESTAAIVIFMVVHIFLALLMSVYAGVMLAISVLVSDICTDIFNIEESMSSPICLFALSVGPFCNELIVNGFVIVVLASATVLSLFILQCCGIVYANSVSRSKYMYVDTIGHSSEMFISSPIIPGETRFDGVWNAYGAQTVLGVKSRGQDIPPGSSYPMRAVAPIAPAAALGGQSEIKDVTLHMRENDGNVEFENSVHVHVADV